MAAKNPRGSRAPTARTARADAGATRAQSGPAVPPQATRRRLLRRFISSAKVAAYLFGYLGPRKALFQDS